MPEFGPTVLEVLRQPIEEKVVTISRAQGMEVTRKIDVVHSDPDRSRDPTQYLFEGWYPVYVPQGLCADGSANSKLPSEVWSELADRHKTHSLRGLAKEYGVSHETVRRMLAR